MTHAPHRDLLIRTNQDDYDVVPGRQPRSAAVWPGVRIRCPSGGIGRAAPAAGEHSRTVDAGGGAVVRPEWRRPGPAARDQRARGAAQLLGAALPLRIA